MHASKGAGARTGDAAASFLGEHVAVARLEAGELERLGQLAPRQRVQDGRGACDLSHNDQDNMKAPNKTTAAGEHAHADQGDRRG